jgi:hypothetical protein
MISDWFLSLRDRELFFEKLLLAADQMQEAVSGSARAITNAARKACRWIIRLIMWALISLGISLFLATILIISLSTGWGPPWFNMILLILSGIAALGGMVLLAPIVMIMQPAIDAFPSLKQSLKKYPGAIASASFLILFTLFSYWKLQAVFSAGAAASIFFVMLMIGLGSATGWVVLPPVRLKAVISGQLFFCFFFVLAMAIFPRLLPATSRWLRHNEASTAERLDDSISRRVRIDPDNPPAMFNADGTPRFSFSRDRDGTYRVFPAELEYDPDTGQKTSPVSGADIRAEILAQAKAARDASLAAARAAVAARDLEQRKAADAQAASDRAAADALEAKKRNAATLAAERDRTANAARIEGYISDKTTRNLADTKDMAVVAITSDGGQSAFVSQAISDTLGKGKGVRLSTSLFADSFVTDGYPQKVFAGQNLELEPLGLAKYVDSVVFAKNQCKVSNTGRNDLLSAQMRVSIRVVSTADCRIIDSVELDAAGVGMSAASAEKMAAERIAESVAKRQLENGW